MGVAGVERVPVRGDHGGARQAIEGGRTARRPAPRPRDLAERHDPLPGGEQRRWCQLRGVDLVVGRSRRRREHRGRSARVHGIEIAVIDLDLARLQLSLSRYATGAR